MLLKKRANRPLSYRRSQTEFDSLRCNFFAEGIGFEVEVRLLVKESFILFSEFVQIFITLTVSAIAAFRVWLVPFPPAGALSIRLAR